MFTLWPAIDLRFGQVVRLEQGRDASTTVYGTDPLATATSFVGQGATALHMVDLDAAFGDGSNLAIIAEVARQLGDQVRIQAGGGIRNDEVAAALLEAGVHRVVVGSAAVENPAWVQKLVERWGAERIVVGLDARDREVRLRGWVGSSGRDVCELARELAGRGLRHTVFTNIARDGMLAGPDLELSAEVARCGLQVVVSGGVGSLDDVAQTFGRRREGFSGVIVGRALYEQRFGLGQALQVCRA